MGLFIGSVVPIIAKTFDSVFLRSCRGFAVRSNREKERSFIARTFLDDLRDVNRRVPGSNFISSRVSLRCVYIRRTMANERDRRVNLPRGLIPIRVDLS